MKPSARIIAVVIPWTLVTAGCNQEKWGPPVVDHPPSQQQDDLIGVPNDVETPAMAVVPRPTNASEETEPAPPQSDGAQPATTVLGSGNAVELTPPSSLKLDPGLTNGSRRPPDIVSHDPMPKKNVLRSPSRYPELTDKQQKKLRVMKEKRSLKLSLESGAE